MSVSYQLSHNFRLKIYNPIFDKSKAASEVSNRALYIQYPFNENGIGSSFEVPFIISHEDQGDISSKIIQSLSFKRKYYILKYVLTNVGAGNAIDIEFSIDSYPVIPPFALQVGGSKVFILILGAELLSDKSHNIRFEYKFRDVASISRYEQHEEITLFIEADGALNSSQNAQTGVLSSPLEVAGETSYV